MKAILFVVFSFSTLCSFAQEGNWWNNNDDTTKVTAQHDTLEEVNVEPGEIKIVKDKRIDKLIEFKSTTVPPATAPQVDGYRVQLFFDQSKTKVNEARAKVLEIDVNYDTYIEYDAPNYNLLLGNFRTTLEAEKLRAELREHFPAAIIVDSRIYFPDLVED
jgi:tRNA U34 5-carboxymethylaminomethyl modifying enzyme MnmG/GidA